MMKVIFKLLVLIVPVSILIHTEVVGANIESEIKLGQYIAIASDCVSCHTAEGGESYAGGRPIETPFGTIYSPNITPDNTTGIGLWNAEKFRRAVRDGIGKHGQFIYPVMLFDFYTKMSKQDVDALFVYLQTINPVKQPSRENEIRFPFNIRASLLVWRTLFFEPGEFKPDLAKSALWNRGAYLVEGPGHCSDCHSPRNILGGIKKSESFSGGEVDDWAAVNITSDLTQGIGGWQVDELVRFMKTGVVKGRETVLGPMALVVENSLSHLTENDLKAIAVYLKDLPSSAVMAEEMPEIAASDIKLGQQVYESHCAACHLKGGVGLPGTFPPLKANGVVVADDPDSLLMLILKGIPKQNNYIAMPSFAEHLNDDQIAELANYIRSSWDNKTSFVLSTEYVRNFREKALP